MFLREVYAEISPKNDNKIHYELQETSPANASLCIHKQTYCMKQKHIHFNLRTSDSISQNTKSSTQMRPIKTPLLKHLAQKDGNNSDIYMDAS